MKSISLNLILANVFLRDNITSTWDIQYFSMESLISKEISEVSKAVLYIFITNSPDTNSMNPPQTVLQNTSQFYENQEQEFWTDVYYVKWNSKLQKEILVQTNVVRSKVVSDSGSWIKIDVHEIVNGVWLKNPTDNLGLHIKVKTKSGQVIPVGIQYQKTNVS